MRSEGITTILVASFIRPGLFMMASIPDKPKGWQLSKQQPGGFRSGVADVDGAAAVAVGPNGEDISRDFGLTWRHTDALNLNAVFILDIDNGWAVGPKGTIARFQNRIQYQVRTDSPARDSAPVVVRTN
jgi:hypothetical protein